MIEIYKLLDLFMDLAVVDLVIFLFFIFLFFYLFLFIFLTSPKI